MAELALNAALVLFEIGQPLLDQLKVESEVQSEIQTVKEWLTVMRVLMDKNYDHHRNDGRGAVLTELKVLKVRTIANDIEDVMEEFVLHSRTYPFHRHGINRKLHKFAHNVRHHFPLCEILEKTSKIRRDITIFKDQTKWFPEKDLTSQVSSNTKTKNSLRANSLLPDNQAIIGYEKPREEFTARLVDGESGLVRLAVAGPTGSGKTTFVKNVYSSPGIKGRFDCHAWVYVSRNSDPAEHFIDLLKQFCASSHEPYPAEDGFNAMKRLHRYLVGKKYIVVLVDVWSEQVWDGIKDALPDKGLGSRVVVITCSSDVASICASSDDHVYSLNGLEWEQGWELFRMNAFPDMDGECPSELKDYSIRILIRCEGLPLAILAISRALADRTRIPKEWKIFHDIFHGTHDISNALLPGYLDLSSSLKSCLLYFSIFPEGHSVKCGRLIRLWVAEGFALGTEDQTAEEVANDYLTKLINMNLVHVSSWDFDDSPRSCRALNLVHNFIIQKCKDENFASVFCRKNTSEQPRVRRMSVHNDCLSLPQDDDCGGVRTMLLFRLPETSPLDLKEMLGKLKLVRVLDFQGAPLTDFPQDMKRFFILKYLNLSCTKIKTIPSSIKKLPYLETLDLKHTDVTHLPKEISHLHNLRHILAYKYTRINCMLFNSVESVGMPAGIGNLVNLQKLSLVKVDEKGQLLHDLMNMTQLRKLGLTELKEEHGEKLHKSVGQMTNLVTLDLCSIKEHEYLQLGDMSYLPSDTLQRLYLKGRLKELPASISSLHNLHRIGLKWSKLESSPLRGLQSLQNLIELRLVDCYVGMELIFEDKCFMKLRILVIEELPELITIAIGNGAMPELKTISLRQCPKLTVCPLGIHSLTKLEALNLYDMPEELISRLRKNSEDHDMIKHLPVVRSFTSNLDSWEKEIISKAFIFTK